MSLTWLETLKMCSHDAAHFNDIVFINSYKIKVGHGSSVGSMQDLNASGPEIDHRSLVVRKPVFGVSDQVRHKPGCTATEDG